MTTTPTHPELPEAPEPPRFVLADVVEILEAADGAWRVTDVSPNGRRHLTDTYGNRLELLMNYSGGLDVRLLWAVSRMREELRLDARGGATRIATALLALTAAPAEDSAL